MYINDCNSLHRVYPKVTIRVECSLSRFLKSGFIRGMVFIKFLMPSLLFKSYVFKLKLFSLTAIVSEELGKWSVQIKILINNFTFTIFDLQERYYDLLGFFQVRLHFLF